MHMWIRFYKFPLYLALRIWAIMMMPDGIWQPTYYTIIIIIMLWTMDKYENLICSCSIEQKVVNTEFACWS